MDIEEGNKTEFNMANSTLIRINDILKEIKDISIKTELIPNNQNFLSKGKGQHMKLKLVRDLFVQSLPLLPSDVIEPFKARIQSLKPQYRLVGYWDSGEKKKSKEACYNTGLEQSLDDFVIDLQIKLQKKGFFMPSKDRGGLQ